MTRCIPSQTVLTPGSPSPLRAKNHPAEPPAALLDLASGASAGAFVYSGCRLLATRQDQTAALHPFLDTGAPQTHYPRNPPCHNQVQYQRTFDVLDIAQLHGLDLAAILENV